VVSDDTSGVGAITLILRDGDGAVRSTAKTFDGGGQAHFELPRTVSFEGVGRIERTALAAYRLEVTIKDQAGNEQRRSVKLTVPSGLRRNLSSSPLPQNDK